MNYGTESISMILANGDTKSLDKVFVSGNVVKNVIRYTEGVKITEGRAQLHAMLDELLDLHDQGKILDPCIDIETDTSTHRVKRAMKSWTDPESRFFG